MQAFKSSPTIASGEKVYHCGTLTYTKAGLAAIFAWLLWGDFCYTLMETVVPSILPLKLKSLDAPNWMIGMIITTLPGILNMTICPWISFKSDRYRSRWGRRIPFIAITMPFLCISLALLGWSDDISKLLRQYIPLLHEYAPATITICLIAFFMFMFQFFYMFVGSVFWYLFNDIVPPQFIGRFVGAIRIIGTIAGALYNFFVFKYANIHMREIFIGVAILYFIGLGVMCLMCKEGKYPPCEGEAAKDSQGREGIKTFLKESFSHKFYWLVFLSTAFNCTAWLILSFDIFFKQEMGLNLDQIGKSNAIGSIAVVAAMFFMSIFVDRWHPLRIGVYAAVFGLVSISMNWVWIFVTLPGDYFFWLNLGNILIATFLSAIVIVARLPQDMRLFPQSRFGQFCSAQALVSSVFRIAAGIMAGLFIDIFKWFFNGSDFAYRFTFLWMAVFAVIGTIFLLRVYTEWYKLGGDEYFHPPAPWSPLKVEEMPIVSTVGPQTKWLNVAFRLFDGIMGISTLSIPCLIWWMYVKQEMFACKWFCLVVLPFSVLAWLTWMILKKKIRQDMKAAGVGMPLGNGIPHHGMLIIFGSKFLLAVGIWICQIIAAVSLTMEKGVIVFGIANVLTNFLLIGGIWLMCRIERGYSRLDTFLSIAEDDKAVESAAGHAEFDEKSPVMAYEQEMIGTEMPICDAT